VTNKINGGKMGFGAGGFRGHKYGAIRTKCHQDHAHPSKGEAEHCDLLHLVFKSGKYGWRKIEQNRAWQLKVGGAIICVHRPDWTITEANGALAVVEFKGHPTPEWKLKHKLFCALYPNVRYTIVSARAAG